MSNFPFFSLPEKIQRETLGRLNILDAFKFSMLSKRASWISQFNHSLIEMCWSFGTENAAMTPIKEKNQDVSEIYVSRTECTVDANYGQIRIGDCHVVLKERQFGRTNQLIIEYGEDTSLIDLIYPVWESVWRMIKIKHQVQQSVTSYDLLLAFKALEVSKNFKNFKCIEIIDEETEVTAAQIKFLLEEISCKEMWLGIKLPRNKAYLQPLKNEYLRLNHVDFIKLEALLESEMIELHICEDSLSDTLLNAILKSWLQGSLPNLQQFHMKISTQNHSKDTILDGIPWVPFTEVGKPDYSQIEPRFAIQKYHDGVDIKRADGLIATLLVDNDSAPLGPFVEVFIWHKEYKSFIDKALDYLLEISDLF